MHRDQRIVSDVAELSSSLASTLSEMIIQPLTIIYYARALVNTMSLFAPITIFGYFLLGMVINKILIGPVVALGLEKV